MKLGYRYVPSNSEDQMNRERARRGLKPSPHKAMDDFLMSQEVQGVADEAGKDIVRGARELAVGAGLVETGRYVEGFESKPTEPVVAGGNPRRAVRVSNEAVDENGFAPAAAVEFGNAKTPHDGLQILTRAGNRYHTPRGV